MEHNIVVDEHDNVIDSLPRDVIDERNLIYRVSALWVYDSQGRHLLAQRALTKSHSPGKWGPAVAGTVAAGETYEQNISKETAEEIGLTNVKMIPYKKVFRDKGNHRYFCQWYTAVVDKPAEEFVIDPEEVAQVKWYTDAELRALPDDQIVSSKGWMEEFIKNRP